MARNVTKSENKNDIMWHYRFYLTGQSCNIINIYIWNLHISRFLEYLMKVILEISPAHYFILNVLIWSIIIFLKDSYIKLRPQQTCFLCFLNIPLCFTYIPSAYLSDIISWHIFIISIRNCNLKRRQVYMTSYPDDTNK